MRKMRDRPYLSRLTQTRKMKSPSDGKETSPRKLCINKGNYWVSGPTGCRYHDVVRGSHIRRNARSQ